MRRSLLVLVSAGLAASLLPACAPKGSETPKAPRRATVAPAGSTVTTPIPSPGETSSAAEPSIPAMPPRPAGVESTQRQFGYLRALKETPEGWVATVDYATLLTGKDADKAAVAAGEIEPGEHVPNDYFITNVNPKLRTLTIAESVEPLVGRPDDASKQARTSLASFARRFDEGEPVEGETSLRLQRVPYWFTVAGTAVLDIEEQYLP